jgi:hypothetical protein
MRLEETPQTTSVASVSTRTAGVVGLAISTAYVAAVLLLMQRTTYDTWGALVIGPALVLLTLPALARQANREADRRLFWLLLLALTLKLIGGFLRAYVASAVYGGVADASGYHGAGARLAERFRVGDFDVEDLGLKGFTDTDFIRIATGALYTLIGSTRLGGFLVFSWLGFWGIFLFYRAFTLAVPEGRRGLYGRLLFFLPSMLFWPSSIGKEAWMVFALGVTAYGGAKILSRSIVRGLPITLIGLGLVSLVRPHIAGLVGVALALGYLFRRPRVELRELAPVAKVLSVAVVALVAAVLVVKAQQFLAGSGIETGEGVGHALLEAEERTAQGGSEFTPTVVKSPIQLPLAVLTVLFRPLLFEAGNFQALVAAAEGTFLLGLAVFRFKWVLAALRSVRRQPYVAFAVAFTAMFVVAYSSIANFGILARQRVQVFPILLVLLCIPPRRQKTTKDRPAAAESLTQ